MKEVALSLGNVAAGIAALKGRQAVAYSASANLAAAAAGIEDTDFAKETANLAKKLSIKPICYGNGSAGKSSPKCYFSSITITGKKG